MRGILDAANVQSVVCEAEAMRQLAPNCGAGTSSRQRVASIRGSSQTGSPENRSAARRCVAALGTQPPEEIRCNRLRESFSESGHGVDIGRLAKRCAQPRSIRICPSCASSERRCEVDDTADSRVVPPPFKAKRAQRGKTLRDADAEIEVVAKRDQRAATAQNAPASPAPSSPRAGPARKRERVVEEDQDPVARKPIDRAVVFGATAPIAAW